MSALFLKIPANVPDPSFHEGRILPHRKMQRRMHWPEKRWPPLVRPASANQTATATRVDQLVEFEADRVVGCLRDTSQDCTVAGDLVHSQLDQIALLSLTRLSSAGSLRFPVI